MMDESQTNSFEEGSEVRSLSAAGDKLGRVPDGPGRGWRVRERKAKSCDICEGDLWIEKENGLIVQCRCRERRAGGRARNRLRAGEWWRGMSLSFASPPLAQISPEIRDAVEALLATVRFGSTSEGIWLEGDANSGKSALCAYVAQRLYPSGDAIVERTGDLLAHLRWLGAVKGELAVERRLEMLAETPLLVLDDVDRAIRSWPIANPLSLHASCASQDLIRIGGLLRDRRASLRPTLVTSRAAPQECPARLASVTRKDLVRGLLGTALGTSDPFEAFPAYPAALLKGAIDDLRRGSVLYSLDLSQPIAAVA